MHSDLDGRKKLPVNIEGTVDLPPPLDTLSNDDNYRAFLTDEEFKNMLFMSKSELLENYNPMKFIKNNRLDLKVGIALRKWDVFKDFAAAAIYMGIPSD
jgi:hypothetical protein